MRLARESTLQYQLYCWQHKQHTQREGENRRGTCKGEQASIPSAFVAAEAAQAARGRAQACARGPQIRVQVAHSTFDTGRRKACDNARERRDQGCRKLSPPSLSVLDPSLSIGRWKASRHNLEQPYV